MVAPPPLPAVPIGCPGYKFKFPVDSPAGQDERREHERIRKAGKRAAARAAEPPPLPPPPLPDAPATPGGEPGGGTLPPGAPLVVDFIPWTTDDFRDTTDELVELSEARRVSDFVAIAKEAGMPPKFVAQIEKDSGYPVKSKEALKRCVAACAAKWMNKTGVSAANKEEAKLLFVMLTVKLQGLRLRKELLNIIEADRAQKAKAEPVKPAAAPTANSVP